MKKMFRVAAAALTALVVLGTSMTVDAAQKIVAVMPVDKILNDSEASYAADDMTEELTNVLANSGSYTIIERGQLDKVLREMSFEEMGPVDQNTAIEMGKLSGAQYILVGKITMADVYNGQVPILGLKTLKAKVGLEYRLLDGKTGQILMSSSVEDSHTEDEVTGKDFSDQVVLHSACKDVAEKVLKEIQQKNPIVGTILDVDEATKTVYVDLGRESGLKPGEKLLVYKEGAPILSTTGEILATKTIELGEIKVQEVNDNHSVATITDEKAPFSRGALVKREFKK